MGCEPSGLLPSDMCSNMPNIKVLYLYENQLQGRIPPNIWKCRHLEFLALAYNNLNGKIPSEIGSLSVIKELYLNMNNFQGTHTLAMFAKLSNMYMDS